MMWLAQIEMMTQDVTRTPAPMSPEKHVWLAYAVVTALLWGYAAAVLLGQMRLRRWMKQQGAPAAD